MSPRELMTACMSVPKRSNILIGKLFYPIFAAKSDFQLLADLIGSGDCVYDQSILRGHDSGDP